MRYLVFLGAIAMASAVSVPNVKETRLRQGGISVQVYCMKDVGAAKKRVCIDKTPRDWQTSSEFCYSIGMELLSIDKADEFEALNAAVNNPDLQIGYNYWTAGRDSQQTTQFVWDATETALVPAELMTAKFQNLYRQDFQSCVFFRKLAGTKSLISFQSCSAPCYTLCQG